VLIMNEVTFDALTRRASLASLGAAGVAALALPLAADAKNKTKKKAKKKCKSQIEPCVTILTEAEGSCDPDCVAQITACCQFAGNCDFNGWLTCLTTITP
jgi:hypothetical protein